MNHRLTASLAAFALAAVPTGVAHAAASGDDALAKFSAAWAKVNAYTCTITAHEVLGTRVQDRVYTLKFRKPYATRMDITGGDGRGSAVVWDGGDTVYGHKGGILSMFKKHLPLHDPQATSIRGTTVAEANFGALLDFAKSLKGSTMTSKPGENGQTDVDIAVSDPASAQGITRERFVLGANDLPVEFDQWEGDTQVKRVTYDDVALNVDLPDSAFDL